MLIIWFIVVATLATGTALAARRAWRKHKEQLRAEQFAAAFPLPSSTPSVPAVYRRGVDGKHIERKVEQIRAQRPHPSEPTYRETRTSEPVQTNDVASLLLMQSMLTQSSTPEPSPSYDPPSAPACDPSPSYSSSCDYGSSSSYDCSSSYDSGSSSCGSDF